MDDPKILHDKYLIKSFIDKGGTSDIYLAFDMLSKEWVAVKQIVLDDSEYMMEIANRLRHEYRFLCAVNHPNIVNAKDFFEENNNLYLVLEYVDGTALDYLLHQPPFLDLTDKVVIAIQIAEAISVLNGAGIIHRDVKPSNIMVNNKEKRIKLLDLGIGKSIDDKMTKITIDGVTVGTVDYMSPEQIMGKVAPSTDVFGFGVTLYQVLMWNKDSPFGLSSIGKSIQKILNEDISPLINVLPKETVRKNVVVYKKLSKLLEKMLIKKNEKRISIEMVLSNLYDTYRLLENKKNENSWTIDISKLIF